MCCSFISLGLFCMLNLISDHWRCKLSVFSNDSFKGLLGLHLHWNSSFIKCILNNSCTWLSASWVWELFTVCLQRWFSFFFLINVLKTSSCIKAFLSAVCSLFFSRFLSFFFHFLCGRVLFVVSSERWPYIARWP